MELDGREVLKEQAMQALTGGERAGAPSVQRSGGDGISHGLMLIHARAASCKHPSSRDPTTKPLPAPLLDPSASVQRRHPVLHRGNEAARRALHSSAGGDAKYP